MFENGKVYKIIVAEHVMLQEVEKSNSYSIYIDGNKARFLKPNGYKVLFQHTLDNVNYWLYDNCEIKQIETIKEWKIRTI